MTTPIGTTLVTQEMSRRMTTWHEKNQINGTRKRLYRKACYVKVHDDLLVIVLVTVCRPFGTHRF